MADADDDGGQSENKKDDTHPSARGKPFSTMHQEIENKLSKSGTGYDDRVSIVLSGWDHLAGSASVGQLAFATFLHRWTLQLVLQGEWPKLEKIVKTRLKATLQRCCRDSILEPMCKVLLPLVSDPWGNPILKAIIGGVEVSDEDAEKYLEEESWEVVKVRVDTMVESRCEELALSVLKVCMRCIQLRSNRDPEFALYSKQDHNHFVDLYFALLYKYERNKFREELKNKDLEEGIDIVRRLLAQQERAKVWKHRLKIAENAIQIFLTSCIVKPYGNDFWSVFTVWCDVMLAIETASDTLVQMVQKFIQLAESSQHIYTMASIFHHKFGEGHAAMVTELLIRALTLDMNSLERVKYDKEENKEEQVRLEHQMAAGFMDLAAVFDRHMSVARECMLTAFSLHPTLERLEKLKEFAQDSASKPSPSSPPVPSTLPNVPDEAKSSLGASDAVTFGPPESALPPQNDERTFENEAHPKDAVDICMKDRYLLEPKPPEIKIDTGQNDPQFDKSGCEDQAKAFSNESTFPPPERCSFPDGDGLLLENLPSTPQDDPSVIEEDPLAPPSAAGGSELLDERDLSESRKDGAVYDGYYSDAKIKDEVDSMDGFLANAEGLIKQLDNDNPIKKESENCDILTAPQAILNEKKLGITKELCDDMAVVLSSPRWQVLSWMLCKDELLSICEKYLRDSDSAKNLTKELKYLNIDYNLFRHLPSEETDLYTGIEKGYEHFMDEDSDQEIFCDTINYQYSSGSDGDFRKRRGFCSRGRKGRPPLKSKQFGSDSDSTGNRGRNWTTTSLSDSDSDFDAFSSFGIKTEKGFEGKRVTAVSSNDRCKRLKVDAATGRVRASKGHVNHLRLYRHTVHPTNSTSEFMRNYNPNLGSVNTNQSATPSQIEKQTTYQTPHNYAGIRCKQGPFSPVKQEPSNYQPQQKPEHYSQFNQQQSYVKADPCRTVPVTESRIRTISQLQDDKKERNWKYSGYLVSNSNITSPPTSQPSVSVPVSNPNSPAVRCSYRTKEGRVINLNTHCFNDKQDKPLNKSEGLLTKVKGLQTPSKFEESFTKFLMQQNAQLKGGKKPSVTITRRPINLKSSLDLLKRQGTSVTYKQNDSTTALANAQKDVLNRIMSPENSRIGPTPSQLPFRAIAMPVSHNPPNLSPDKNSPANLSRVLPKGTTVVRRPKSDPGAGPSGLNNGGAGMSVIRNQLSRPLPSSRPTVSITPSSSFLISNSSDNYVGNSLPVRSNFIRTSSQSSPSTQEDASPSSQQETFQTFTGPSPPLTSATVVGSVSQILSSRLNSLSSSPREMQGGSSVQTREVASASGRSVSFNTLIQGSSAPTATTVATMMGEPRAPSMLETLLRDRSPTSPIVPLGTGGSALTNTTSALPETLVVSSPASTGVSNSSASTLSEAMNLATSHSSPPVSVGCNIISTPTSSSSVVFSEVDSRSLVVNAGNSGSMSTSSLLGVNSMGVPVVGHNVSPNVLSSSLPGTGVGSGVITQVSTAAPVTTVSTPSNVDSSGMHQVLLPAQLIQVQGTDGSTGLGIVHSGSLDLRLPPGTRVIKSANSNVRAATPVAISQPNSRQVNVLHNVKIVQNRQIVRTVVVPHSVAIQGLGSQQTAQLVAITQSSGSNSSGIEIPSTSRIQPSQLHKMLGTNVVPGGLVIRAVRPQVASSDVTLEETNPIKPLIQATHVHHTSQTVRPDEKDKDLEKAKVIQTPAQEEGLGERLTRHYLKTALLTTTSTQSVGTQTQTTAVKPVTGQIVNQVMMNPLRGISASNLNNMSSASNVNTLSLTQSNAVSSETLEQLREFESVFEKVSNKSGKESEGDSSQQNFNSSSISSEESMIAAQLLSMANETPPVTSASNFVASVNTSTATPESDHSPLVTTSPPTTTNAVNTGSGTVGSRLNENTFITIPCTTQAGTLILVNPSVATSGLVTMAGNNAPPTQPPPPASPALSSTSSHSSVASSPSSTSSKTKKQSSKPKVSPTTASPSKPKSPPPPKAPPKPTVAKPQVEESDETKARIQAILDKYKQDLANNPQPQPAPRNRKNCPPPKSEGKSSSKKKGQVKKSDGGPSPSPQASDSGHLHSLSASPAPLSASGIGEDSEGSACSSSLSGTPFQEEKPKAEETASPQILQGVVVSNVKVDNSNLSPNVATLPAGLAGGRVFQLIRHGNKVTAITTQQPYSKVKAGLTQGGPPPNVTIQGRINMSDLMENHIASLLAGSSNVNQGSSLIGKLLQSQQLQASNVQQVVVQTSGQDGQPVVQQLSLQPVLTANAKAQISTQNNSTVSNIIEPTSPLLNSPIKTAPSRASPSLPAGVSASPGTPQHRPTSPPTPSSTPSPFPSQEDDTNSSEQSNDSTPTGPLPPFFTLTKQFMIPSQGQQFSEKPLGESFSHSGSSQSSGVNADLVQKECAVNSPAPGTSRIRSSSSSFSEGSFVDKSKAHTAKEAKVEATIDENNMLVHSNPNSPSVVVKVRDSVLDMSPGSCPSSLENSPVVAPHRVLSHAASSDIRSNSMDSVKSDLSVEEVQIPPSPATLTKQIQNAYMTEAALSPVVSQAHLSSSSSFSSPATVQDLHFAESHNDHRELSPGIGSTSHSYTLAGATSSVTSTLGSLNNGPGLSSNGGLEGSGLASLSSGDIYLDQAGVSLGLDSLPLEEGSTQSPSLSDIVPAVPLLSWSPRSADSLMGQSPSLNEALTSNIALDVHPSEDSLCDSSTGFPALFSIEGDGASVSSSTSDDLPSNTPNSTICTSANIFNTPASSAPSPLTVHSEPSSSRRTYSRISKEGSSYNREQDHTVSSTHSEELAEDNIGSLDLPEIASSSGNCNDSPVTMAMSPAISDNNWRFDVSDCNKSSDVPSEGEGESKDEDSKDSFDHFKSKKKRETASLGKNSKENSFEVSQRRRSQRQLDVLERKGRESKVNLTHNGYERQEEEEEEEEEDDLNSPGEQCRDSKVLRGRKYSSHSPSPTLAKSENKDAILSNLLNDDKSTLEKQMNSDFKKEPKQEAEEPTTRITRGLKRRSEGASAQEDKKVKSNCSEIEVKVEDVKSPFEDSDCTPLKSLRNRNISGTSDSSSNYSIDRVSTPTLLDSPLGSGSGASGRRRRRRLSHDSSVSSRDGSPLTLLQTVQHHDTSLGSNAGVNTRRASSRDHAKKTRCACCTDAQQQTSQSSSSRRSSGRVSRGSGPSSS